MCGICGIVQLGGPARVVAEPDVIDRMTDTMTHRGPSDRGTLVEDGVAIGVRRLSIVDVEGGHQPFANEARSVWAVQNGELYNHADIRKELSAVGHSFASRCDTEILPHLYEQVGTAFPERLRGMFGIALWDRARRRAVLVRDRLGIKPLYYAVSGDLLVFASELKALLASGLISDDLDHGAIDAYLALGFFPGPATPLRQVRKLEPGHRMVVESGGIRVERYWAYPVPDPSPPPRDPRELAEELLDKLDEAVRVRLMADVPLGAMLSGGLDSSLIVALMARHSTTPVSTFAVGFHGEGAVNELADARLMAETVGADHHELELSMDDAQVDLPSLVWSMDEPLADLSAVGFMALSELASRHVTVALSGQGADELLGGYRKHRAAAAADAWARLPRPLGAAGAAALSRGPARLRRMGRTLAAQSPAGRLLAMAGQLDADARRALVRGPLAELDGHAARRAVEHRLGGLRAAALPTTLYLDAQLGLVDDMLHYFDRASMAHSLEVRVPFLDHHLVEHCAGIPVGMKVRRLTGTKYLLKCAARGLVPDRIIDKPKVGFFNDAVGGWFRAQAGGAIQDYLLDDGACYADLLDRREVARLVAGHAEGRMPDAAPALLSVLMLEVWLRTYLPRARAAGRRPSPVVLA
jgi:asparagine synthase (glutamine-hydrolysing)